MPSTKDLRTLRKRLGLSQTEFWTKIGVTQSAGSRYEAGREMPAPTKTLVALMFGPRPIKTLAKLRGVQVEQLR